MALPETAAVEDRLIGADFYEGQSFQTVYEARITARSLRALSPAGLGAWAAGSVIRGVGGGVPSALLATAFLLLPNLLLFARAATQEPRAEAVLAAAS